MDIKKRSSMKIVTFYLVLPVIIVAAFILPFANYPQSSSHRQDMVASRGYNYLKYTPTIPLGLMTPEYSGVLRDEVDVVADVLLGLNEGYGNLIELYLKIGSTATDYGLKTLLRVTERTHVSSHGEYNPQKRSGIELYYDDMVYAQDVTSWTLINPKSDLLFLSACESLGYDGHTESTLAQAFTLVSSVDMVIGYNDVVDSYSSVYIAHKFWWYLTRAAEPYGGFDGHTSFDMAKDACQNHIYAMEAVAVMGAVVLIAWIWNYFAAESILAAILGEIAENALMLMTIGTWLNLQQQTCDALEYYGETEVPPLVWTGGGDPWGDDLPF